ncbi:MAG TPA: hypothetical protein VJ225_00315 [Nitrososphaeraceae archaeon]|nr:hypothetical protein [Nitrososphaeraceae archaeon]
MKQKFSITFALVIGLVLLSSMQYAHGYIDPERYIENPELYQKRTKIE